MGNFQYAGLIDKKFIKKPRLISGPLRKNNLVKILFQQN